MAKKKIKERIKQGKGGGGEGGGEEEAGRRA